MCVGVHVGVCRYLCVYVRGRKFVKDGLHWFACLHLTSLGSSLPDAIQVSSGRTINCLLGHLVDEQRSQARLRHTTNDMILVGQEIHLQQQQLHVLHLEALKDLFQKPDKPWQDFSRSSYTYIKCLEGCWVRHLSYLSTCKTYFIKWQNLYEAETEQVYQGIGFGRIVLGELVSIKRNRRLELRFT